MNEDKLRNKAENALDKFKDDLSKNEFDINKIYHELQVYKVELELQYEELLEAVKKAEEKSRMYTDLYDFSPVSYLTLDINGIINNANLHCSKMLEVERSNLIGKDIRYFVNILDLGIFDKFLSELSNENQKKYCEITIAKLGKKSINVKMEGTYSFDKNQYKIIIFDVTEQKNAEKKLQESEIKYRLLADNLTDVVWTMDLKGVFNYVSPSVKKLRGFVQNEAVKQSLDEIIHISTYNIVNENIKELLLEIEQKIDNGARIFEAEQICKDGSTVWTEISAKIMYDDYKNPKGIICISRDISKRRIIEFELQKSKEKAESNSEAKSKFLANMSHEIRTPMNGIIGIIQLMKFTDITKRQKEYMNIIDNSSVTLLNLINDILDYSKIEAGIIEFRNDKFDLKSALRDVIDLFKFKIIKNKLEVKVNINENVPIDLIGDPFRLKQIISNLVGNAVKFTDKGTIGINVLKKSYMDSKHDKVKLEFVVYDTGIGILEDNRLEIFKSFSQEENKKTFNYGGVGLGLSISKSLVEMMGGEIWVESKKNKGSKFHFTCVFDINKKKNHLNIFDTINLKNKNHSSLSILIVEDEEINKYILTAFAKKIGWIITVADNGYEAAKLSKDKDFDAIIMDIKMPVMDGYSATKIIRKNEISSKKHVPIIAMTAYALINDRETCLKNGMDDYIAKPVDSEELYSIVEKWCAKKLN